MLTGEDTNGKDDDRCEKEPACNAEARALAA